MWTRYDRAVVREELAVLADHGLNVTRSFCYWPDFVPEPGRLDEELLERFRDFLDAHVEHEPRDDPDVPRRPHVRRELGPGVAAGPRPVPRRLDGRAAGVARRRDRAALRRPPGRRRLARLERDAAVRRPRDRGRGRGVGAARRPGRPRCRRDPAALARRRCVGGRDDRRRQRLLAPCARAARRLRRAARVPDGGRPGAAVPHRRVRVRARRRLRPAGRARGVRRQLRLRRRRARGRVLPAGAPHDAARRRARVDRLEQHRLRRPPRRGPVPAPRLRAPLRADRRDGPAEAAARRARALRAARPRARPGLGADSRRRRAARARALRARAPVHLARVPAGPPGGVVAGLRRGPGG